MSWRNFIARITALWPSRGTTLVLLVLYLGWLGRGVWLGIGDLYDRHTFVKTRMHFVGTQKRWVSVQGEANLLSLRSEQKRCWLRGMSNLNVAFQDATTAEVRLVLEFDDAPRESHVWILDTATNTHHYLYDLHPWRVEVTIPLPVAKTTLNITPAPAQVHYRIVSLEVTSPMRDEKLVVRKLWSPYFENDVARISLGSGCWLRDTGKAEHVGQDELLFLRRHAYLQIEPKTPGDCWVAIPFKKILPGSPDPVLTNDNLDVEQVAGKWSITDYGTAEIKRLAFGTHLKPVAELGFHFEGTIHSQRELGISPDRRPMAYGLVPAHLKIVKTAPELNLPSRPTPTTR